jgi:surfeit locus 1 family protein
MARPRRRWGSLIIAFIVTVAVLALLLGLGTWQLQRLTEKEDIVAKLTQRLSAPPIALPPREAWPRMDAEHDEFQRVTFPAEFLHDQEALVYSSGSAFRPDVTGPGYWVFTPARLLGGSVIVVNRGFVPEARRDPASRAEGQVRGVVDMTGVLRWPEQRGRFMPADDPDQNQWFVRDHLAMAEAKGWGSVAPFSVDLETPVPPGGVPKPGKLQAKLPNNPLQYAITWYGLAGALVLVFGFWARQRLRSPRSRHRAAASL